MLLQSIIRMKCDGFEINTYMIYITPWQSFSVIHNGSKWQLELSVTDAASVTITTTENNTNALLRCHWRTARKPWGTFYDPMGNRGYSSLNRKSNSKHSTESTTTIDFYRSYLRNIQSHTKFASLFHQRPTKAL